MEITINQLQEIMEFLDEDLDTGVGSTEREWIDNLDELKDEYSGDKKITKKMMDKYWDN